MDKTTNTKVSRLILWLKNHRLKSVLIMLVTLVIGVGQLTDSIDKIIIFTNKYIGKPSIEQTERYKSKETPAKKPEKILRQSNKMKINSNNGCNGNIDIPLDCPL